MNAFNLFLLLSAIYFYGESAELPEERTVCQTKEIWIPSGKVTQSGVIHYVLPISEGGKAVKKIIHDECKSFVESTRVKRRALSNFVSVARKASKKIGRGALKLKRKGAMKRRNWSWPKAPRIDIGKVGRAGMNGLRLFNWDSKKTIDMAGDLVETAIETIPEILEVVRSKDSSSEEAVREENREEDAKEFRSNLRALLKNNNVEGLVLNSEIVQSALGSESDLTEIGTVSDVKCKKDEFTGIYSLRFRVNIPVLKAVEIRNCGDIGILNGQSYEYYDVLDDYILERDGKSYAVNGSLCVEMDENKTGCSESAFREVSCSVMHVQNCEKVSIPIEKKTIKRRLPVGGVYYGPAEMLFFNHRNITFEFKMTPFHLEYLNIPEAVRNEMEEFDFFSN